MVSIGDLRRLGIVLRAIMADAIGMLGEAQPGLSHRGPERPVAFIGCLLGPAQAILGVTAVIVSGTHATIPRHGFHRRQGKHPRWAKSGCEWGAIAAILRQPLAPVAAHHLGALNLIDRVPKDRDDP